MKPESMPRLLLLAIAGIFLTAVVFAEPLKQPGSAVELAALSERVNTG